jgi:hypothetical protein
LPIFAALALILALTAVPGLFTIDEAHYLATVAALRHGGLALPDTAGLPRSAELLWFDPMPRAVPNIRVPVTPTAPPLYAPVALPFALLGGYRALVLLNVAAFLATVALVFALARRLGGQAAGWWAAAAFALGGYALEYAQGMWPQSLSAFLVLLTLAATAAALGSDRPGWLGLAAGLAAGLATGIRFQNLAIALALLGLALWRGKRRGLLAAALLAGLLPPLAASSAINAVRLETRNPVTKGEDYVTATVAQRRSWARETAVMLWARIADYSARPFPPPAGRKGAWSWLELHPETGAPFCKGVVKKAWLQSSPWLALALAGLGAAAWRRRHETGPAADLTLAAAAVCAAQLGLFAFVGPTKDDQMGFNQRYLMELVAPLAVFLGVAVAALRGRTLAIAAGAVAGAAAALAAIAIPIADRWHSLLVMRLPLALASLLLAAWLLRGRRLAAAVAPLAAAAIAWATLLHLGTDVRASRELRRENARRADLAERVLPADAAVVTWSDRKDFLGRLLARRDLVVLAADYDRGATAPKLVEALLARGTRVFVWVETVGPDDLARVVAGRATREVARLDGRVVLVELD